MCKYNDIMPNPGKRLTMLQADGKRARFQVAIKELYPGNIDEYPPEATTLAKLSRLHHPHLIRCIATYRQGGMYCSLFPWADGGNLRQFWALENAVPRNANLITWAVKQMNCIASGIVALHNFSLQENCRHGDLKPQNILRFLGAGRDDFGTLVVSDLGSATFHSEVTETRRRTATAEGGYGTLRYEPPEAHLMKDLPRSRRYNVWSAGCIFLEFLIWLLYRWRGLKLFYEGIDRYWLETSSNHRRGSDGLPVLAKVHPKVQDYMRRMRNDPRCSEGGAIGDLLKVIKHRLLVSGHAEVDPRVKADDKDSSTAEQSDSETSSEPPRIVINSPTFLRKDEDDIDGNIRADSVELGGLLDEIFKKVVELPHYAFKSPEWEEVGFTGLPPPLHDGDDVEAPLAPFFRVTDSTLED